MLAPQASPSLLSSQSIPSSFAFTFVIAAPFPSAAFVRLAVLSPPPGPSFDVRPDFRDSGWYGPVLAAP